MFSEALKILDRNTVKYMIEELQKQLEEKEAEKAAEREALIKEKAAEREALIKEKEAEIKAKDIQIAELKKQLEAVREHLSQSTSSV